MILLKGIGLCCLIFASLVALFYNLDYSKEAFGSATIPLAKYLPYWLTAIGFVFLVLSIRPRFAWSMIFVCLFFAIAISGSLYALLVMHVPLEESYIGRSLGGLVFVAFYWLSFEKRMLELFLRVYVKFFFLSAVIMSVVTVLFSEGVIHSSEVKIYHPDFLLAISSVILARKFIKKKNIRYLFWFFIFIASMMTGSATDKLLFLLALLWVTWGEFKHIAGKIKSLPTGNRIGFGGVIAIGITGVVIAIGIIFNFVYVSRMGEREDLVRISTFLQRWHEFLENPVLGNLFTGSPLVDIGSLHIPSHSDILDLLAFGGLVTIILYFVPMVRLVYLSWKQINQNILYSWMLFLLIAFLFTSLMNPILAQPRLAFHFFLVLGILMGWITQLGHRR